MPFFSLAWALLVSQPSGALEIPRFRLISAGKKCNLLSSVLICLYLFFFFLFFFSSLHSQVCNLRIKARICTGFRAVLHSSSPGSSL